ncbi:helix-turn-helix transcriptional regulator [Streptomyces mexicanus]|uniref:Helix-turn-helix transcriptional regulator n=1 Tax=Streptomyces mexicanus TaxID=178566 RepID=A0A7X1I4B8_9ACTN|nr:helix-turn-helix transcriptional regulator [Streptomyces mexicanus]MBC2868545.1 helix-turn-helix transcriptional regulator [Streptomyces mexicanus]
MSSFEAIDALLASAPEPVPLPPAGQRRRLREDVGLSRAQVARALGVSPSTLGGWEAGRDPSGQTREKYAYFLRQAEEKIRARATVAEDDAAQADPSAPVQEQEADGDQDLDQEQDQAELAEPQPCVLCGLPARYAVAGYPQHLDPTECNATVTTVTVPTPTTTDLAPDTDPGAGAAGEEPPARRPRPARPGADDRGGVRLAPVGRRVQAADTPDLIGQAVAAALAEHSGDVEAATAALVKRAIPDAMALLDATRKGGRYDIVAHPWLPDILRKKTARGADEIWEARPKWTRPELPPGEHQVTALDINGAYLSALKTWLPLGQLEHTSGNTHDRRRSGFHLITPPAWEHQAVLPNPIGARDEPGPVWVGEPTLRQLLRLSGPKYGLCDPPVIHESWTSGATETLLEKFRILLKDARDKAISQGDEVTLEYVKAMYSKFVSTLGESNYNREIYRQDWMHLIRSQAFANLWMKAFKAYDEGLTVVRAMGTDELHVIGDWRAVFPEGRAVTEVKVKDTYTLTAGT